MKIVLNSIIFAHLFFSCWSYAFEPIKLVCEGEGEESQVKPFAKEEVTNIKGKRTYIITSENKNIYTNENNDYVNLKKVNKKVNVIKFKSFFYNVEISDGSNYTFVGDDQIEESENIVKISDDLIYAKRSNTFITISILRQIQSFEVEIDRVSGTFTENYYHRNDQGIDKGTLLNYKTLKGTCKKIAKNQF